MSFHYIEIETFIHFFYYRCQFYYSKIESSIGSQLLHADFRYSNLRVLQKKWNEKKNNNYHFSFVESKRIEQGLVSVRQNVSNVSIWRHE